jgi:hypothetical protein
MILDTEYKMKRMAKKLREKNARITGFCTHQMCLYYIIDDYAESTTHHVLVASRPTWQKRYWDGP